MRVLPVELNREICGKLPQNERRKIAIHKYMSNDVAKSIKNIPEDTLVTLFKNGLYDKFKSLIADERGVCHMVGNPHKCGHSIIHYSHHTYIVDIMVLLDTVYYGYSFKSDDSPSYRISVIGKDRKMVYNPVLNHTELTKRIRARDIIYLVNSLATIGDKVYRTVQPGRARKTNASNDLLQRRDKIIYEFVVILRYVSSKYKRILLQEQITKAAKKETDKLAKLQEKQDKAAKKETDKLAKLQEKQDKAAKKETDKLAKLQEKQDKTAKKEADKLAKLQEKQDKAAKKEADKLAKLQEKRVKAAKKEADKLAKASK